MLDYKDIITRHFALGMSGGQIAEAYLFSSQAEGAKISTWQNDEKQTSQ